ncbi:MAG: transglycosylase domain-containing protein, partial [Sphingomonadaceae bacterium]
MAGDSEPPSRLRKAVGAVFQFGLYGLLFALIALVVAVAIAMSSLPSYQELKESPYGQMIRVRAADGSVIVSMGPRYGEWLAYDEIPPIMIDAMVAVEDRRFRSHPGIDPLGIARGIWVSIETGEPVRGVSTISQQISRNIFLTNDRSLGRKLREGILALALERRFSKNQILELYLNRVYFGGGAYGIDAASHTFFNHSARDLSLSEAAIIAGLVKAPSNYAPTADAEAARDRADVVINLMVRNGTITPAEAARAAPAEVDIADPPRQNSARYFTDWAIPQLEMLIDEAIAPIDVWTTLDMDMQRAADEAINANTPKGAQGALVALDRDGAVRAMVGGRDYVSSIYNRATQSQRQPGSAFKLFVYLAALEAGYLPSDTVIDEPVTIDGWSPRNSTGRYSGAISLREAFARSVNTIAAKLGAELGFGTVADMGQRFGITTKIDTNPSMVLGTSLVRLIDMTRAFASVAAKGTAVVPYGIRRVTTTDGELLYEHQADGSRTLAAPWVAAQMTDLLQSAVLTGTGRSAQIGRPVAGKTGTTSSNKDGWFLGFSSGLTAGIWMGRDDNKAVPGLQGGRAPARAFHDFMIRAVADRPVEKFDVEVTLPDWQLEPEDEDWLGEPDDFLYVDPDGRPLDPYDPFGAPEREGEEGDAARREDGAGMDQDWLDEVLRRQPGRGRPGAEGETQRPA